MTSSNNLELSAAYQVLGVFPDMTQDEMRSAYRRIARKNHPDRDTSPEAQETMMMAALAWETVLRHRQSAEALPESNATRTSDVEVMVDSFRCILSTDASETQPKQTLRLPLAYCMQNAGNLLGSLQMHDGHGECLFLDFGMRLIVTDGQRTAFEAPSAWTLESHFLEYLVS